MNRILKAVACGFVLAAVAVHSTFAASTEEMQLLNAAQYCYIDELEELLDSGVDPDAQGSGGHTPLIQAAFGECIEAIEILLDYGADPYIENDSGYDAFDMAVLYGYSDVGAALGATLEEPGSPEPESAWQTEAPQAAPDEGWTEFLPDEAQRAPASTNGADAGICKDMYLSCQATCAYYSGNQYIVDYSCTAQCAECNRACEAGQPTACTGTFRPWGGQ